MCNGTVTVIGTCGVVFYHLTGQSASSCEAAAPIEGAGLYRFLLLLLKNVECILQSRAEGQVQVSEGPLDTRLASTL